MQMVATQFLQLLLQLVAEKVATVEEVELMPLWGVLAEVAV
jgi:hypothetical protein